MAKNSSIPLSIPKLSGNEWKYVKDCLDSGWVSSAGKYVEKFELKIKEYTGSKFAVACTNGTSALQISLLLAGVKSGDEVIAPTLTFIAPINAIALTGAKPIFMDSDDYYNIDPKKTIKFIEQETEFRDGFTFNKLTSKKIVAIVPVHVWGNACWLDEMAPLCEEKNIAIIEDASESLGTKYKKGIYAGKHTGTIGKLGCISFNGNKIITTGGGGMILTEDEELARKARYLTTQAKDDPFRYIHDEIGFNMRLSNIHAAIGLAQLEQLTGFLKIKKEIHKEYTRIIQKIDGLNIAKGPDYAENNHWLNLIQINSTLYGKNLKKLLYIFEKEGIQSRPVWYLNHLQKPYKNCQIYKIVNALKLVAQSMCLPSSISLNKDDIEYIKKMI